MRILFAGLFLLFVIVILTAMPLGEKIGTQDFCVLSPNPNHTLIYNGAIYRRIRADTPVFHGVIDYHLTPTIPYELYVRDQFLPAFEPWYDGTLDYRYVNWRPTTGVSNLIFVDVTDLQARKDSGMKYFDIYLKPVSGDQYVLPSFISNFCANKFPIARKTLSKDANGVFIPPLSFYTGDVNWDSDSASIQKVQYYLFSYEYRDSPSWTTTVGAPFTITGKYVISKNGTNKTYKVYHVGASAIKYIGLIDEDTASADKNISYKYVPADDYFKPQALYDAAEKGVIPTPVDERDRLQLETFNVLGINAWGWWTPECKPAIYLYPKTEQDVLVQVAPAGHFTYTDPVYPQGGWKVKAYPDGRIINNGKIYPYLYYESAIRDDAFQKPEKGYVVKKNKLPDLFSDILPKLGLSARETADFKAYWENVLPEAAYYFVGIMDEETIARIEPLTITPKNDTLIRVRLFFEALDAFKKVDAPVLTSPMRQGFIVAEWGGMVKTDTRHPFTCSQ